MDSKPYELYFYDYNQSGYMMIKENILLKQLQEDTELCSNNEHTKDEVTAAIGMLLMPRQIHSLLPKTNPLFKPLRITEYVRMVSASLYQAIPVYMVHGGQKHTDMKHQMRKHCKSNSNKSSLLACCRNILKEFLSQNGM